MAVLFLIHTKFATDLYSNFIGTPVLFVMPILAVVALLGIKIFAAKGALLTAFVSSCVTRVSVTFTGVKGFSLT